MDRRYDKPQPVSPTGVDALLPPAMAEKAEAVGVAKATMNPVSMFVLAVLAGAFVALGAVFATTVSTGGAALPFGVVKLLAGLVFCLGLILVVVAGAELFTGNNLIIMAWAGGKVSTGQVLRNWALVYAGNLVGAVLTAVFLFLSRQYEMGGGEVGHTALKIAVAKVSLAPLQAVVLGMLCNALVCLAVWLCFSARTTTDKILAIIFPITAFVAAGFEHCVANMYFIPAALFIKSGAGDVFLAASSSGMDAYAGLTWSAFFVNNLLPVTIGNIIGGAVMVGLVYWFVYIRGRNGQ